MSKPVKKLYCLRAYAGLLLLLTAVVTTPAWAATIFVNTINDVDPANCTLRDAITAASSNFITNGCAAGDTGQDTIQFLVNGTITLGSALPSVSSNITISGPGSTSLTISGGGATVINVSGSSVVISGLTLTGGNSGSFGGGLWVTGSGEVQASNLLITANNAFDGGGVANDGTLVLMDSSITNNTASGGTYGGGGIYNSGTLTLDNVSITGNSTSNSGGGILNRVGILSITDSTVNNNTVTAGNGAGIYNDATIGTFLGNTIASNSGTSSGGGLFTSTSVTLEESTFTLNSSNSLGGGIYGTIVTLVDSSITSNTSTNFGGGVYASSITLTRSLVSSNSTGTAGGGLYATNTYSITNSTLNGNSANTSGFGGAAYLGGSSTLTSVNSTFTGNSATAEGGGIWNAGTVNLTNSILSSNTVSSVANNCQGPGTETWNSNGYNIESENTCGLNATGDQFNTDPMLAATLQDNGGPTLTYALLTGSPAIDAANNATCPATDQRGALRPQDGNNDTVETCDIGAYEVGDLPADDTNGGDFGEGGCFIATAAHGTAMAEDVRYLRAFRDQYLLQNEWGKKFVDFYYRVSPPVADKLREYDALRSIVRVLLKPLVWLSKNVVDPVVYDQQTASHP